MFKYASRLSRHYFEKTRVRDLLVEHVVNRHLAQILKVFLCLALRLTARDDFVALMFIETLSVWFLQHFGETQAIWETLNPKIRTYQLWHNTKDRDLENLKP